jgi:hypothetical protein
MHLQERYLVQANLGGYATSSLFIIDHVAKPLPNAAQTLEDPHFEEPESQQPFFYCITQGLAPTYTSLC